MSNGKVAMQKALDFLSSLSDADLIYLGRMSEVDTLIDLLETSLVYLEDSPAPNGREWKNLSRTDIKDLLKSGDDRVLVKIVQNILREKNT